MARACVIKEKGNFRSPLEVGMLLDRRLSLRPQRLLCLVAAPGGGAGTGMFPCTGVGATLLSAPFRQSPIVAAISPISLEVEGAA